MPQRVITVEGLGKEYRIGGPRQNGTTFREMLASSVAAPLHRLRTADSGQPSVERIWALKDVSLEVSEGEVVGIIGRNGAGKSTLLKILSRITEPTQGRVTIYGRIASLLEVGTGFHSELTGRENVYLNGAILGMSRKTIDKKFDAIVDFAGVEKFIDTPVKRFSSGMHMRLAFSVAAHLDSDILLMDEVLAVGDSEFQKKCLGKMEGVARQGRTVFFVSHSMNAIQSLCRRAILFERGCKVQDSTNVANVVGAYLNTAQSAAASWTRSGDEYDGFAVIPWRFFIGDENGCVITGPVSGNSKSYVYLDVEVNRATSDLMLGYAIFSESNIELYHSYQTDAEPHRCLNIKNGRVQLRSMLPQRLFNEGTYYVELGAHFHNRAWIVRPGANAPRIAVEIKGEISDSPMWITAREGILAPVLSWESVPGALQRSTSG
jgi:lipopolysaccharide transport system ATP-binding protein